MVKMTESEYEDWRDWKMRKWEYAKNLEMLVEEFKTKIHCGLFTINEFNNFIALLKQVGTKCFEVRK